MPGLSSGGPRICLEHGGWVFESLDVLGFVEVGVCMVLVFVLVLFVCLFKLSIFNIFFESSVCF